MTRATMILLLRRRLQETTADQWTDSQLGDLLNYGLQQVQKYVLKVNPEAVIYVDTASIVADQELYAWPQGMLYEIELGKLDSATGKYTVVPRADMHQLRGREEGAELQYAHHGRYFLASPMPAESLAAGWQLLWVPTLEMATGSDVPPIIAPLHPACVVWAQKLALGETGEALEELRKEIADIVGDTGEFYLKSASNPTPLSIDLDKGY
ncbi:MAG: hypothetical protein A3E78_01960 [Alphaproteobacteria bacterium RIFCSPHIGHO2_12_FULL_63_12]|nr:MAG: hypothetical protein A3E78_01960 [Alphaproteobacteria bacterium RIFCSPHIGHO2_12_FULL_63_12]